jgi:hypothetical protein
MQLTQASLACDNEKLTEILDEKLEYEAAPDPIVQWPWQYARSGIPVSHPQMCMQAAEISDCDGPLLLEVHAWPPATTPAANANPTAIQSLFIARLLHQPFRIGKANSGEGPAGAPPLSSFEWGLEPVAKLCHQDQQAPRLAAVRNASGGLASPRPFPTEFRVEFLVGDSAIRVSASGGLEPHRDDAKRS